MCADRLNRSRQDMEVLLRCSEPVRALTAGYSKSRRRPVNVAFVEYLETIAALTGSPLHIGCVGALAALLSSAASVINAGGR